MPHLARLRLALASLVSAVVSSGSFAHHPGGPGNTGNAGPIITLSATTLDQGTGIAALVFDYMGLDALSDATLVRAAEHAHEHGGHAHIHSLDAIFSPSLNLAYGVTNDLTVSLRLPYVLRTDIREAHVHGDEAEVHARGDSEGLGDLSAMAQWRFFNNEARGTEAALVLGVKAPTGDTDERDREGERFDAEFQPGSGSWDGMFGVALTQHAGAWSFDASVLCTLVTEGVQSTDLGDRVQFGVAVSYRLAGPEGADHHHGAHGHAAGHHHDHEHEHATGGPALDLILELSGEWQDEQEIAGERDPNSGGTVVYLAPGVRLTKDRWSGFVSVGIPVVNELNGIQAEPDWRLISGITLGF
jgi:hypothetical protein